MKQMVTGFTRLNPPRMIDPIITTLHLYYQKPTILPPLDPDPDSNGSPSDHLIPIMRPINVIENKSSRTHRRVKVRPITLGGLSKLKSWMSNQSWSQIIDEDCIDKKAVLCQELILEKVNLYLPEKFRKIASDDQPWVTEEVKRWNRKRQREYSINKRSDKYFFLNQKYQEKLSKAKKSFKRKMIDDIKTSNKSQWYSKLKWISSYDQQKHEDLIVDEISHLPDDQQGEAIADSLASISNEYSPLRTEDIEFEPIPGNSFPQFSIHEIQRYLENIKTKKSTLLGDIPAIVIKECSQYLCTPVRDLINKSILAGKWAKIYKQETITPIPKAFPPETINLLRPIANLPNLNKTQEAVIAEMVIKDMEEHLDPSQYGNRKNLNPALFGQTSP